MAKPAPGSIEFTERDLSRWHLIEDFKNCLHQATLQDQLHPSWSNPQRLLLLSDYLSLFLFGLLNPVVRTMRGLCGASHLPRVQQEICSRPVSLGSFSEAQSLLEPALLAKVFEQLGGEWERRHGSPTTKKMSWLIQDGSLFEALPRMSWALWRRQGTPQAQVRLHLTLDLETQRPLRALITTGKECERAAWRKVLQGGDGFIADRYYGEDYKLFKELENKEVAFVIRLRDQAVITVEKELALSATDQEAKVIRSAWARLGCSAEYKSQPVRVVWVQTDKEVLILVTNVAPEALSAAEVALLYKERWRIEIFFRWLKCILGCRHWLAESTEGAQIELYLALIAALLLQLYTGQAPNKRMMELIQFYLMGVASLEDLWAGLQRERERLARRKKS